VVRIARIEQRHIAATIQRDRVDVLVVGILTCVRMMRAATRQSQKRGDHLVLNPRPKHDTNPLFMLCCVSH
jgi:hypothetical protein